MRSQTIDIEAPVVVRKQKVMGHPAFILEVKGERVAFGEFRDAILRLFHHFDGEETPVRRPKVAKGGKRAKPTQETGTLREWVENYMGAVTTSTSTRQVFEAAQAAGRETTIGGVGFYMTNMKKTGLITKAQDGSKKGWLPTAKLR